MKTFEKVESIHHNYSFQINKDKTKIMNADREKLSDNIFARYEVIDNLLHL